VARYPLDTICADHDARLRADAIAALDAAAREVETVSSARVAYDALVLALGARRVQAVAGAVTFEGEEGIEAYRAILADLDAGRARSLALVVPDGVTWPLPLYELALMTAERLRDRDVELTLVTPEADPLHAFGQPARERVRALLRERGIELRAGAHVAAADGLGADRVVALPRLSGAALPGVPADAEGFVPVDEHGAVIGAPGVYAAGDGTDQPVKQGGLAAQQADAVAAAIAAAHGAPVDPAPFVPELRAQLLTGTLPWWFRGGRDEDASQAASAPLWQPSGKVAAKHLAPYLADRLHARLRDGGVLHDVAAPERDLAEERQAALDMALALADDEAAAGEPGLALRWLQAAEGIAGTLPAEYVAKRRRWAAEPDADAPLVREPGGAWSP
jgi:sulfide:quinone oxidoreductase